LRDFGCEKRVVEKNVKTSNKTMNARLLALALCSLSILIQPGLVQAQDTTTDDVAQRPGLTNGATSQPDGLGRRGRGMQGFGGGGSIENGPTFDIQIENGQLFLAPLAGRSEITNFWARGTKTVPATMENISRYLRATDPHLNIILSPGTGDVQIFNLKLKTTILSSIPDAIDVASGDTIRGSGGNRGRAFFGPNGPQQISESSITFTSRDSESHPVVEVFNLSGYIQSLGKVDDDAVTRELDELRVLIMNTLKDMHIYKSGADMPSFKFHPGTKLLIVIGKPEAIDVTRKIVNALSGQQKNGMVDLTLPSGQN
jgi:hypothetical protein